MNSAVESSFEVVCGEKSICDSREQYMGPTFENVECIRKCFSTLSKHTLRVCLESVYFAETENFLLKIL